MITAPPLEQTWNLSDLFATDEAFQESKQEFARSWLPTIEPFRGHLLESPARLAEALEQLCRVEERLHLLHCYACLKSDQDTRRAEYQAMRKEVELLGTDLAGRTAWLRPEILAAEPEVIEGFLSAEPRLADHAHFLRDLLRQRPYVLGPAEEKILADSGLLRHEPSSLYQILTQAELPRPELTLSTGEVVRLTPFAFQKHRTTRHRGDRQAMFREYYAAYDRFKDTLGQNLFAAVKAHVFLSRTRGYPSCLAAALDGDNVPEPVYDTLIEQVHENLPTLHRYLRLRARALGLDKLEYHDLHGELTDAPTRTYGVEQAGRVVVEGLAPLGPDYRGALLTALGSRWIDWHAGPGKRSGAYATGQAYRVHPYVLLNFGEDHDGVLTLAHELGHAIHSHFSNRAQPFATANYSIFVAEVASTFNEALVLERMAATAETPQEKLFFVTSTLDRVRATVFRQAMFAEFEREIHRTVEEGGVLTGESLCATYLGLLRLYHGHDAGVMNVEEAYAVEWAAIPHMYYDFYVYQYATGLVAATALARAVLDGRDGARERYLSFLRSGGSDYSLELLRRGGVDLEEGAPYVAAFATVERQLDRLEEWLERRPVGH